MVIIYGKPLITVGNGIDRTESRSPVSGVVHFFPDYYCYLMILTENLEIASLIEITIDDQILRLFVYLAFEINVI